jgi:hypothetical protein
MQHMDPYVLKGLSGNDSKGFFRHKGEEMPYVLEGKTKFFYGDKEFILVEADCFYFYSSLHHDGLLYANGNSNLDWSTILKKIRLKISIDSSFMRKSRSF